MPFASLDFSRYLAISYPLSFSFSFSLSLFIIQLTIAKVLGLLLLLWQQLLTAPTAAGRILNFTSSRDYGNNKCNNPHWANISSRRPEAECFLMWRRWWCCCYECVLLLLSSAPGNVCVYAFLIPADNPRSFTASNASFFSPLTCLLLQ